MTVTVMVLFGQMLESTTKNAMLSQGSFFAETVLERYSTALRKGTVLANSGSQWITFADPANQTIYNYQVDSHEIPVAPAGPAGDAVGKAYSLTVEVNWWQEPGANRSRSRYGKLNLRRSRMVYVQLDP